MNFENKIFWTVGMYLFFLHNKTPLYEMEKKSNHSFQVNNFEIEKQDIQGESFQSL